MDQHLRIPLDPLIKLLVRRRRLVDVDLVRHNETRLGLARYNHVAQIPIVRLHIALPSTEVQSLRLLTMGIQPQDTDRHTFSNSLPNEIRIWPFLLCSSGAPGSAGTYKPGIPKPPVGRVTMISWSSTMFGFSLLPDASTAWYPTASTARSTIPSLSLMICSTGSLFLKSMGMHPIFSAAASRSGTVSTTKTLLAPRRIPLYAAIRPTGPAPNTATLSPDWNPASTSPCHPVGNMSASSIKSASCSVPLGNFNALKSANGTRRYCAWPP
ncbi:hypothetical protein CUC08_Gglean003419 [Alternaria sp. MG1]|nr:hypothetical protein CUC08_Gglean003419 [Alternaria sp. MG1]